MNFLSPASLWTLAALALPLAIHLWRRPPRTVRLGSLRALQSHARPWRNLRWREYVLLVVRLALLTLLAFLLARPVWQPPRSMRPARWALVDPAAALSGASLDRLHALQSVGYETRLLAPAFPLVRTTAADPSAAAPDLWSLLREADAVLPADSTLAIFSPGRLTSLRGLRPALARSRVEWIDTPAAPSASSPLPLPSPTARKLTVSILHDPDRAEDARYLAAALQAVSQTNRSSLIVSTALTSSPAPHADWIFWLSARPVPPAVAADCANIFTDASTAPSEIAPSRIVPQPGAATFGSSVRLWRRNRPTAGSVLWTDGCGQPLLTRTRDSHHTQWHFASRFLPAWNDLPLGSALPASLRVLFADAAPTNPDDLRLADPSQCPPSDAPAGPSVKIALPAPATDLRAPLWSLAALCFCLERLLSHRRSPRSSPAPAVAQPVMSR